ncbi:hypothetical protein [Plantibacter sp. lyk4-40-MEA-4]|uniref:hypothetical protein n=1 Tax=Plantibacter sp. lyk4-40-MEA-4 TaxID=3040298 RepID=UPI00254BE9E7|nr:hypothetical protein [Plantibacter sp. lyk4-40-MEA-4]
MKLAYGRDDVISDVAEVLGGLHLVTGTSGMGKSLVITAAAQLASVDRASSGPVRLESASGSLQRALLAGLADIWIAHLNENRADAAHLLRQLRAVGHRLLDAGVGAVGKVVVDELLALAKSRLGDQVGAATIAFAQEMLTAEDRSLLQRLRTTADPDLLSSLLALGSETAELIGRPLTLYLDQAERLSTPDWALLADLPERLRDSGIAVVVAVNSDLQEEQNLIRRLIARGAREHRLHAIRPHALQEWLHAAEIAPRHWTQIDIVSSRVPFDVRDAIDLLNRGDDLEGLSVDGRLDSLALSLWESLDREAREHAMVLSALRERPSDDCICALLECSSVQWAAIRQDFVSAGVFLADPETPWFHDRRRSWIWANPVGEEQCREIVSRHIATAGPFQLTLDHIPYWLISLMGTICANPACLDADTEPTIRAIAHLSREALAVVFALIELEERSEDGVGFTAVHFLAGHAATVISSPAIRASAFEELQAQSLIATAANQDFAIAALSLPTQLAYAAVLGRIRDSFHRYPQPQVATAAFETVLRPAAPQFEHGFIGIGAARPQSQFSELARKDTHDQLVAIAISGKADDRPFAAAMSFTTVHERDQATRALTNLRRNFLDKELIVESVVSLPGPPLRSRRYALLRELIAKHLPDSAIDVNEERRLRVALTEALRLGMSPIEAAVTGHTEAFSILTAEFSDSVLDFHISGGEARYSTIEPSVELSRGPWVELQLRAVGALRPGERLGSTHYRFAKSDIVTMSALMEEVESSFSDSLSSMSRMQPTTIIAVDEVRAHVMHMRSLIREDTARLRQAGLPINWDLPARRTLITLARDRELFDSSLSAVVHHLKADEDTVEGALVERIPDDGSWHRETVLTEVWGTGSEQLSSTSDGQAEDVLAQLMSFQPYRDVRIVESRPRPDASAAGQDPSN